MCPSQAYSITNCKGCVKAYFKIASFFHHTTSVHAVTGILLLAKNPTETKKYINFF